MTARDEAREIVKTWFEPTPKNELEKQNLLTKEIAEALQRAEERGRATGLLDGSVKGSTVGRKLGLLKGAEIAETYYKWYDLKSEKLTNELIAQAIRKESER